MINIDISNVKSVSKLNFLHAAWTCFASGNVRLAIIMIIRKSICQIFFLSNHVNFTGGTKQCDDERNLARYSAIYIYIYIYPYLAWSLFIFSGKYYKHGVVFNRKFRIYVNSFKFYLGVQSSFLKLERLHCHVS